MLSLSDFESSPFFSDKERAALSFAVEITANNRNMRRAVKDRLKAHLTDPEIVDLTLACCWYNFMNRFNSALEVDIDTDVPAELLELMESTPAPDEIVRTVRSETRRTSG